MPQPLALLCIASSEKGQEFMREDIFYVPENLTLQQKHPAGLVLKLPDP